MHLPIVLLWFDFQQQKIFSCVSLNYLRFEATDTPRTLKLHRRISLALLREVEQDRSSRPLTPPRDPTFRGQVVTDSWFIAENQNCGRNKMDFTYRYMEQSKWKNWHPRRAIFDFPIRLGPKCIPQLVSKYFCPHVDKFVWINVSRNDCCQSNWKRSSINILNSKITIPKPTNVTFGF